MRALIYIMTPVLILTIIFASRYVTWEKLKGIDKQALQHLANGTQYIRNGKYDQAITAFTQAIEIEPKYAEAYIKRGFAYFQLAQYTAAIADYTHTLSLKRYIADAYAGRGDVYRVLNDYKRALNDYSASIEDRKNAAVMSKRAKTYLETGKIDEAIEDYSYILKRRSTALLHYNRGIAYQQKYINNDNKNDLLKLALTDFNEAIKKQQHFALAYLGRGDIYGLLEQQKLKEADYAIAIDLLTDAIKDLNPPKYQIIPIYLWRAIAYYKQGNISKVKDDLVKCYQLLGQFYLKNLTISDIL